MKERVVVYNRSPPLDVSCLKATLQPLLTSTDDTSLVVNYSKRAYTHASWHSTTVHEERVYFLKTEKAKSSSYRNKDNRLWNNRNVSPLGEQCKFKGFKKTLLHLPRTVLRKWYARTYFVPSHTILCCHADTQPRKDKEPHFPDRSIDDGQWSVVFAQER